MNMVLVIGEMKDGSCLEVSVRVLEGLFEREAVKFIYVGWRSNNRYCEMSFDSFATLSKTIKMIPILK